MLYIEVVDHLNCPPTLVALWNWSTELSCFGNFSSLLTSFSYLYKVNEEELKESVILVFANKQDLPNALSTSELTEKLGLHNLRGRKVNI